MSCTSPKSRDFFITINKGAECYNNVLDIVLSLNIKLYALIYHNRDYECKVLENGEIEKKLKNEHLHLVIELKNPITFESCQNKFLGAHIDVVKYKRATYQYLLHNSPNSKEKYQYDFADIISNNKEAVHLAIQSEEGLRLFKESEFMVYIAEGIKSKYQFVKAFGLNVYKQYWNVYSDMLKLSEHDIDMILDLESIKNDLDNNLPF